MTKLKNVYFNKLSFFCNHYLKFNFGFRVKRILVLILQWYLFVFFLFYYFEFKIYEVPIFNGHLIYLVEYYLLLINFYNIKIITETLIQIDNFNISLWIRIIMKSWNFHRIPRYSIKHRYSRYYDVNIKIIWLLLNYFSIFKMFNIFSFISTTVG